MVHDIFYCHVDDIIMNQNVFVTYLVFLQHSLSNKSAETKTVNVPLLVG